MTPRSSRSVVFLLGLYLAGCSMGEGEDSRSYVARDSAGIQIVENFAPSWEAGGWRLSPLPVLQIGEREGAPQHQLHAVTDALRLPDGRIAVASAGSHDIRIYDETGTHSKTIGRQGGGPGEFEVLAWLDSAGDSLFAYDQRSSRLSAFTTSGEWLGSIHLHGTESDRPRAVGRFGDGSFLVSSYQMPRLEEQVRSGVFRSSTAFLRYAAGGAPLDTLATVGGPDLFVYMTDDAVSIGAPPFARFPVYALGNDRVALGGNENYEFLVTSADGARKQIIRKRVAPRPVTTSALEALKDEQLSAARTPRSRKRIERTFQEARTNVGSMPFYADARFDIDHNLWVQDFRGPDDPQPAWTVFDATGRMLGGMALPDRFRPMHIGRDFIVGIWKDEMDVEYVRMYNLEKPE